MQALRALRELADTDTITGLSSRARAEDLLATTLQQGKPLSVLVIDLDEFKDINDSHGHAIGDLVLERVGARLRETIPAESIIGRLGGDELVVGLLTGERGEAGRLATKILAAIARPLQLDLDDSGSVAIDLSITASIGIAVAPRDGGTAHELLGHADSAMYAAKRSGRASHRFYRTETDIASRRLLVSTRLRRAVDADEITVAYQPIVDLQSERIIGFEALARWTDSQLGRVQPDEFIALAENTPLIDDLFDRVLQQALRAAVTWNSGLRTGTAVALGVNLAARQLTDPKLPKRIANAARAARFPLAALRMEITETAMMNHATARKVLGELSAAGIGLVIDDYGVGFSNIDVLTDLSRAGVLSSVKFDRSLVADLPTTRSRTLLSTFLGFATALDVTPVVEGIETAEQLAVLLEVGCPFGQGFHLGRPMSAEAACARVREQTCL
ncbi:bifunctional diguanylate cyclase/phosphodiesterase [Antrihabitans sp. YC2-6]|uniref:putative bifunctional diguanylate cyclase/phosphodiesterase n=1 Tax=Antrihabitans sp. YC2-6 TaxID=2799498 RepID=UPI0018F4C108|nr:EAL domain-containing protein [Antrihabitans sp. YC2-6]MBJ8348141.1 EAL domain-containing protein [Antrihabitans sp. YC2-6]